MPDSRVTREHGALLVGLRGNMAHYVPDSKGMWHVAGFYGDVPDSEGNMAFQNNSDNGSAFISIENKK